MSGFKKTRPIRPLSRLSSPDPPPAQAKQREEGKKDGIISLGNALGSVQQKSQKPRSFHAETKRKKASLAHQMHYFPFPFTRGPPIGSMCIALLLLLFCPRLPCHDRLMEQPWFRVIRFLRCRPHNLVASGTGASDDVGHLLDLSLGTTEGTELLGCG